MRARAAGVTALVSAWLMLLGGIADARVPSQTPRRRLEGQISRSLNAPAARGAVPGVFAERGGTTVLAVNADRPLTPASLTKIATTTAAMIRFGPSHRFATSVAAEKLTPGGVVAGDLVLIGGGDPAFSTEAYGRKRFLPDPGDPAPVPVFRSGYSTVEDLADAVKRAGVTRITGSLLVDESLFDSARTQPGWLPSYQKPRSVDVGNLSALTVNEGFNDIDRNTVAPDPAMNAGRFLRAALRSRGIEVGDVRHGRTPAGAKTIARVLSPPISDLVSYTNRYSVNYTAEMLLKNLGAKASGRGSTDTGVRALVQTLRGAGIPLDGLTLTDGSGLSVMNRMTPRTIGALIRYALDEQTPAGKALRESMPVAGGPGTLLNRMLQRPTAGNLRGKTGLLRGVRGMAGWVTGQDGSDIVYVALFNDASSPRSLTGALDLIGLTLARYPYFA